MIKNKNLCAFALLGIMNSSLAFADANLSAHHQLVSKTDLAGGSQAVYDITISNNGSDDLTSLSFMAADNHLTSDIRLPVFELSSITAGAQTTVRVTFNSNIGSDYFDTESLLMLNADGYDTTGQKVNLSIAAEGGI